MVQKLENGGRIENGVMYGPDFVPKKETRQVAAILLDKMKGYGDRIAHINAFNGATETYSSFRTHCIGVSLGLLKHKIQPGDVVTIISANSANCFATAIGVLAVGAAVNVLDPSLKQEQYELMLGMVRPKIICVLPSVLPTVEKALKTLGKTNEVEIIVYNKEFDSDKFINDKKYKTFEELQVQLTQENSADFENYKPHEFNDLQKSVALVICSSGTTGLSKGILLSHYSFVSDIMETPLSAPEHGRGFLFTTLYWISGWYMLLGGVFAGISRVYTHLVFSEHVAFEAIQNYKVENFLTCPSILNRMVKHKDISKYNLKSLRRLTLGGGRVDIVQADILRKQHMGEGGEIWIVYGITEVGAIAILKTGCRTRQEDASCCGLVRQGYAAKIVDPNTRQVLTEPYQTGEILLRSEPILMGYLNHQTAAPSCQNNGCSDQSLLSPARLRAFDRQKDWFETGDLGHRDEEGRIYVTDRVKEMIWNKGKLVCPATIETILWKHPAAVECAVVGLPKNPEDKENPKSEQLIMAFIQTHPGTKIQPQELVDAVAKELPEEYHLNGGVVFLDQLPMLPNEKPDRLTIKRLAEEQRKKC